MTRREDKKGTGKMQRIIGKGGVACPCCVMGIKSWTKRLWVRLERRRATRGLVALMREEGQTEDGK